MSSSDSVATATENASRLGYTEHVCVNYLHVASHDYQKVIRHTDTHTHPHTHTPSIAFRHPAPNSTRFSYATEGIFFISAHLSTDAVSALRNVRVLITLRASLSDTFLQTLKDLVTPLKGHSLSPRSCPPTWSAPSERFGY